MDILNVKQKFVALSAWMPRDILSENTPSIIFTFFRENMKKDLKYIDIDQFL